METVTNSVGHFRYIAPASNSDGSRGSRYVAQNAAEPVESRALLYCAVLLALGLGAAACPRHPVGALTTAGQRSMYASRSDDVLHGFLKS